MNDDLKYHVCHLCGCPEDDAKPLAPMLKEAFLKEFKLRLEHFCATATDEQIRAFEEIIIELTRRQAFGSSPLRRWSTNSSKRNKTAR